MLRIFLIAAIPAIALCEGLIQLFGASIGLLVFYPSVIAAIVLYCLFGHSQDPEPEPEAPDGDPETA